MPRPRTQLLVLPARGTAGRLARAGARAASRAAWRAAQAEQHTLLALAAAGLFGWARRTGADLPKPLGEAIPAPLQYGLLAWVLGRWTRSRTAEHVATGLLSVGIYDAAAYTDDTREQVEQLLASQAGDRATRGAVVHGTFGG